MNNKQLIYIVLGFGVLGAALWKLDVFEKIGEKPAKVTPVPEEQEEKPEEAEKPAEAPSEEKKPEGVEKPAPEEAPKKVEEAKEKPEEIETPADLTDKLNKKIGKTVVQFNDGAVITESEINDQMDELPEQISSRMSLKEVKTFLALKAAFDHVVQEAAKKEGLDKKEKVKSEITKRENTVAGMMFINDKAKELMTDEALKKHYDKTWDENFKGTKEYTLKVVTTSDKLLAENFAKAGTWEKFAKLISDSGTKVQTMDLENRPEGALPPEIIDTVKSKGKGAIIGPFEIRGVSMIFFVRDSREAQKREFSGKFKDEYSKIAQKDFVQEVSNGLYKKHSVTFYGLDGKELNVEEQNKKLQQRAKDKSAPDAQFELGKLSDETVLAKIGSQVVTVADLKKFYNVKSLQDQAFVAMSQQFNMQLRDVIFYGAKLVVEDRLLRKEVEEAKYKQQAAVKAKLLDVMRAELSRAYFIEHIVVSPEQIKKAYQDFLNSIPEEDKNDHEVATKVLFFPTKSAAEQTLSSIRSGQRKFNDAFKEKESSDHSAVDLKYVTRRAVDPEFWSILKRSAAGACYKEVIEVDGSRFGLSGQNFAVVYVGDRRPISLPSLSNPSDKRYFEAMARRNVAILLVTTLLKNGVQTICGQTIKEFFNNPTTDRMIEAILAGNV